MHPSTVKCTDCDTEHAVWETFAVTPPPGRPEGDGKGFYLCVPCWDRVKEAEPLAALR